MIFDTFQKMDKSSSETLASPPRRNPFKKGGELGAAIVADYYQQHPGGKLQRQKIYHQTLPLWLLFMSSDVNNHALWEKTLVIENSK